MRLVAAGTASRTARGVRRGRRGAVHAPEKRSAVQRRLASSDRVPYGDTSAVRGTARALRSSLANESGICFLSDSLRLASEGEVAAACGARVCVRCCVLSL